MVSKKSGISREDFEAFKIGIERLKELQRELNSLNTKKFKSEAQAIRLKLKNVSEIPNIERSLKILKLKIANKYKPVKKRRTGSSVVVSGISDDIKDIKKDLEQNLPEIKSAIKKLGKKVEGIKDQTNEVAIKVIPVNLKRKIRKNRKRKSKKKKLKVQSAIKRKNRKNKIRRKKAKVLKAIKTKVVKRKIERNVKSAKKIKVPAVKKKRVRRHRKKVSGSKVKSKTPVKKYTKNSQFGKDREIKNKIIRILTHEKALSLKEIKKKLKKMGVKKSKGAIKKYIKMIENEGKIKEIRS